MKKRIIGIDLLRILSMYMIMTLHTMSNGGGLLYHQVNTIHTQTVMFLTFLNNIAVDLFAIISGYVGLTSHHRFSRIVELWLQVIFYSYLILVAFLILRPQYVDKGQLLGSLFPTVSMQYWYFNSYILVFIFMPLLNYGILKLTYKEFTIICVSLFIMTSCFGLDIFNDEIYNLGNGFSGMWLIIMYLYGAYIRRFGHRLKNLSIKFDLIAYLIVTLAGVLTCNLMTINHRGYMNGSILYNDWNKWFGYNTPFAVLGAMFIFLAFLQIEINNTKARKIIIKLGALSFGTYLLQTNYIVYAWFRGHYTNFYNHNIFIMVICIFATAMVWYVFGTLVDAIRNFLFKKLNIVDKVVNLIKFSLRKLNINGY